MACRMAAQIYASLAAQQEGLATYAQAGPSKNTHGVLRQGTANGSASLLPPSNMTRGYYTCENVYTDTHRLPKKVMLK